MFLTGLFIGSLFVFMEAKLLIELITRWALSDWGQKEGGLKLEKWTWSWTQLCFLCRNTRVRTDMLDWALMRSPWSHEHVGNPASVCLWIRSNQFIQPIKSPGFHCTTAHCDTTERCNVACGEEATAECEHHCICDVCEAGSWVRLLSRSCSLLPPSVSARVAADRHSNWNQGWKK